jgi:integrase
VRDLLKRGIINNDPESLLLGIHGEAISEETITSEIDKLRMIADIEESATPHRFRHRFITIQVARRAKDYTKRDLPFDLAHTILRELQNVVVAAIP